MKNKKIHYANCEKANESFNYDYWDNTYCGLELEPKQLSTNVKYVTCKNCLKVLRGIKNER